MDLNKMLKKHTTVYYLPSNKKLEKKQLDRELILEEPLSINIQGNNYAVIMRTPGYEKEHATGFCLAEGIIDKPSDIVDIALCDGDDSNVVAVKLTPERTKKISHLLGKRGYISQTGCGLCGREIIDDLKDNLTYLKSTIAITFSQAMSIVDQMKGIQKLRKRCFSSHAVALFNIDLKKIAEAEDVGRHNALDKTIGNLFLKNSLIDASIALLSSRASYEMVQKCARAKIELIISMARPTALAVELGENIGITLASVRDDGLYVFTEKSRISR
jgi:FdhD protein